MGGTAGELPERSLPLLTIARDNGRRLTRLVNDILDIDKIEFGRVDFDLQTMDLVPLVDAAIEANRPFAEGLDVKSVFEDPLDGVQVEVDPGRFAQLMANLLSNAAKFSPPGDTVTVTGGSLGDDELERAAFLLMVKAAAGGMFVFSACMIGQRFALKS